MGDGGWGGGLKYVHIQHAKCLFCNRNTSVLFMLLQNEFLHGGIFICWCDIQSLSMFNEGDLSPHTGRTMLFSKMSEQKEFE